VEEINCPLCETSASEPVIRDNGFTGRQCLRCGLIFVSPRPSRREMDELYEAGEAYLPPEFFVANSRSLAGRAASWHAVRTIRRHIASGSLLEIGPGNGGFLAEAHRRGFDVFGVELNPLQAEFIRTNRGVPCATSLQAAGEMQPGGFRIVYHRDVLSHFYDPIEELRQINELLSDGGYHVFETGNLGDVDHRHFVRVKSFQYPDHLFFYSERSLLELLRRTGFQHVHTYRYSMRPEQILRNWVWRARGVSPGEDVRSSHAAGTEPAPTGRSSAGALAARDVLDLTYYAIRHSLGTVRISGDDPQTLTVVARKVA
jgi:2-polyprenyl-3-methyl-5-hydroxy-6-metoxy-1,4-benzoquinol methylase